MRILVAPTFRVKCRDQRHCFVGFCKLRNGLLFSGFPLLMRGVPASKTWKKAVKNTLCCAILRHIRVCFSVTTAEPFALHRLGNSFSRICHYKKIITAPFFVFFAYLVAILPRILDKVNVCKLFLKVFCMKVPN
jgi:hypothetical protein